jgi:hypothetical protein
MSRKNTEEDFWAKVNKTDDCWEWTGGLFSSGYGCFQYHGKIFLVHRFSVMLDGRDPTGLYVCHKCDNIKCVNPDHLFLGTQQDNMDDMIKKGRHVRSPNAGKLRKLTDDQVREIRNSDLSGRKLSKMYDVATATISSIKTNKLYKDVT